METTLNFIKNILSNKKYGFILGTQLNSIFIHLDFILFN